MRTTGLEPRRRADPGVRFYWAALVLRMPLLSPALKLILQDVEADADKRYGYCKAGDQQYAHLHLPQNSLLLERKIYACVSKLYTVSSNLATVIFLFDRGSK